MNRGANRQTIYRDDAQRALFLDLLAGVTERFRIECHAYCLMDNHYHLLIHTPIGQWDARCDISMAFIPTLQPASGTRRAFIPWAL